MTLLIILTYLQAAWYFTKKYWWLALTILIVLITIFALYQQFTSEPKIDERELQKAQEKIYLEEVQKLDESLEQSRKTTQTINEGVKRAENASIEAKKPNANNVTAQELEKLARER